MSDFKILLEYQDIINGKKRTKINIVSSSVSVTDAESCYLVNYDNQQPKYTLLLSSLKLKTIYGDVLQDFPTKESILTHFSLKLTPLQLLTAKVVRVEKNEYKIFILNIHLLRDHNQIEFDVYKIFDFDYDFRTENVCTLMDWLLEDSEFVIGETTRLVNKQHLIIITEKSEGDINEEMLEIKLLDAEYLGCERIPSNQGSLEVKFDNFKIGVYHFNDNTNLLNVGDFSILVPCEVITYLDSYIPPISSRVCADYVFKSNIYSLPYHRIDSIHLELFKIKLE